MANHAQALALGQADREELQRLQRSPSTPAGLSRRARAVLLMADAVTGTEIDLKDDLGIQDKDFPGQRGEEIKTGAVKIQRIVDFIRLDYRKYTHITAEMEKLNERFAGVLDGQEQYLAGRQQALSDNLKNLAPSLL